MRWYSQVVFLQRCGTATIDDEGSILLRNIGKHQPSGVVAHSRSKRTFNKTLWNLMSSTVDPPSSDAKFCKADSIIIVEISDIMLIKIQPDATVCRYLFTARSLYMFRVSQHPSLGVLKTVTATSGTATSLQRGLIRPRWRKQLYQYYDLYRRLRLQFLVLLMMGAVTPETCRVTLQ